MKHMIFDHDYAAYMTTILAVVGLSFWTNLHYFGFVAVALSGTFGLLLTIARAIDFINTHYEGSPLKFFKEAFILKKPKK